MKHEIHSLTGLRGIAAFYVMMFHYMKDFSINNYEKSPTITNLICKNIISHGYLSVDIFFILSSFVLCLSYQNHFRESIKLNAYWNFLKKRFQRIYLTYIICIVITILIFKNFSIYNFILESLLLQAYTDVNLYNYNIATWSLSIEWTVYLLFPFILFLMQRLSKRTIITLFIFALIILYAIQYWSTPIFNLRTFTISLAKPSNNLNIHFGVLALIRAIICYYLGYLIFKYHRFLNHKIIFAGSLFGILSAIILNLNDIFTVVFFTLFFSGLLKKNIITSFLQFSPIEYLGKISYSLYLYHIVIIGILTMYHHYFKLNTNSITFYFLAITISLIVSVFSYELIEKRFSNIIFNKK